MFLLLVCFTSLLVFSYTSEPRGGCWKAAVSMEKGRAGKKGKGRKSGAKAVPWWKASFFFSSVGGRREAEAVCVCPRGNKEWHGPPLLPLSFSQQQPLTLG